LLRSDLHGGGAVVAQRWVSVTLVRLTISAASGSWLTAKLSGLFN
jgi:hypothetical protein